METLRICLAGEEVLRLKARDVKKITKETIKLLDNMDIAMRENEGVGLAAPQVGVSKRIAIVDVGDGLIEMINPEIIEHQGEEKDAEGCLSVPGVYGDVLRYAVVKVSFTDRNNKQVVLEAKGFKARAIQHELDHLDGILFTDKAENLQKAEG